MATPKRLATPQVWIELISAKLMLDINILDPDGWRSSVRTHAGTLMPESYDTPISEDEFKERLLPCTMSVTTETGNHVDAMRMFGDYCDGKLEL